MKTLSLRWGALLLGALTVCSVDAQPPAVPPFDRGAAPGDPPPVPGADDPAPRGKEPEILGRGPIHQGFAQPSEVKPRPGPVVPKAPPAAIQEVPPEQRPEGDNVVWVPGYWSWDDDRADYIWVSGFWRVPPPGRKWVAGYWAKANGGWRFVSGYWADAARRATPLPEAPPESLDRGPNFPPIDDSYSWVPGTWLSRDARWLWQPGYWCAPRSGWVYTPPCYNWTPAGCVFNGGFWDRSLETRGLPCAPVYFPPGLCSTPGFRYTPGFGLGINGLLDCFWARPGFGYYAFGDYYGASYARLGYQPWHTFGPRYRDPLFGYYRNAFARRNPGWARGLASTFDNRLQGRVPPPPRAFTARQLVAERGRTPGLIQPLASYRNPSLPTVRATPLERERGGPTVRGYRGEGDLRPREEPRIGSLPYRGAPGSILSRPPDLPSIRPSLPNPYTLGTRPGDSLTTRPPVTSPRVQTPADLLRSSPVPREVLRYSAPGYTAPRSYAPLLPRQAAMPRYSSPMTMPRSTPMPRFTAPPVGPRFNALSPGVRGGMSRPFSERRPGRGR